MVVRDREQLSDDEGFAYPLAALILRHNTHVDECIYGADSVEDARIKRDQLNGLLAKGHFFLHKWAVNYPALPYDINLDWHGLSCSKLLDYDTGLKVLGVSWNPAINTFKFEVKLD